MTSLSVSVDAKEKPTELAATIMAGMTVICTGGPSVATVTCTGGAVSHPCYAILCNWVADPGAAPFQAALAFHSHKCIAQSSSVCHAARMAACLRGSCLRGVPSTGVHAELVGACL